MRPFKTHGNAFKGPINIFNNATLVKVEAAVNGFPSSTETPKVSKPNEKRPYHYELIQPQTPIFRNVQHFLFQY